MKKNSKDAITRFSHALYIESYHSVGSKGVLDNQGKVIIIMRLKVLSEMIE